MDTVRIVRQQESRALRLKAPNTPHQYEYRRLVCWQGYHFELRDDSEDLIVQLWPILNDELRKGKAFAKASCVGACTAVDCSGKEERAYLNFPLWTQHALANAMRGHQSTGQVAQQPSFRPPVEVRDPSVPPHPSPSRVPILSEDPTRLKRLVVIQMVIIGVLLFFVFFLLLH